MQLPKNMPFAPRGTDRSDKIFNARDDVQPRPIDRIEPAGCCAQVCTPLGCHCVVEAPFC